MLMSLFSSFDALCADSSFGQKVRLSLAPPAATKSKQQQQQQQPQPQQQGPRSESVDAAGCKNKGKKQGYPPSSSRPDDANSSPGDHHHHQHQSQQRRPRFAVELDGVHCFETIIPTY